MNDGWMHLLDLVHEEEGLLVIGMLLVTADGDCYFWLMIITNFNIITIVNISTTTIIIIIILSLSSYYLSSSSWLDHHTSIVVIYYYHQDRTSWSGTEIRRVMKRVSHI
jgi:hypothetical protein